MNEAKNSAARARKFVRAFLVILLIPIGLGLLLFVGDLCLGDGLCINHNATSLLGAYMVAEGLVLLLFGKQGRDNTRRAIVMIFVLTLIIFAFKLLLSRD